VCLSSPVIAATVRGCEASGPPDHQEGGGRGPLLALAMSTEAWGASRLYRPVSDELRWDVGVLVHKRQTASCDRSQSSLKFGVSKKERPGRRLDAPGAGTGKVISHAR
jgi:hypothetical protein